MVREGTYTHHGKEGIQKMKIQTIGNYAELLRREGLLIESYFNGERGRRDYTDFLLFRGNPGRGDVSLQRGSVP